MCFLPAPFSPTRACTSPAATSRFNPIQSHRRAEPFRNAAHPQPQIAFGSLPIGSNSVSCFGHRFFVFPIFQEQERSRIITVYRSSDKFLTNARKLSHSAAAQPPIDASKASWPMIGGGCLPLGKIECRFRGKPLLRGQRTNPFSAGPLTPFSRLGYT